MWHKTRQLARRSLNRLLTRPLPSPGQGAAAGARRAGRVVAGPAGAQAGPCGRAARQGPAASARGTGCTSAGAQADSYERATCPTGAQAGS